ncbi:hypothetical protein [Carboxylicivirga taeanensis]|uniref:hypothetical protein n=1 Tax=Carboxylicivirga taeanensis TaxID=1416875 RepID=UPI003F6DD8FE
MKTKLWLVVLVLIVSACKDLKYSYFTRINADGTIFKRVVAEGDSSLIYSSPFSFDVNEGWDLRYDKKVDGEGGDTLYLVIAEKTFANLSDVNRALELEGDSAHKDNIYGELNRKFRGFFSFHQYTETFKQRFPFKHLSVEDYLSTDEYAYFFEGDSAAVINMMETEIKAYEEQGESRFWSYLAGSLGIEFVALANSLASNSQMAALTEKDSLFAMQLFQSSVDNGPDLDEICQLIDQQMHTVWLSEAYTNGYFEPFEKQIDNEVILLGDNVYTAEVQVPGLLYKTNANSIEANSAKWTFRRGSFLYKDYTLSLEYRTINYWTFIIVALVLLILVGSFVLKRKT